ncbi:MAG TPA: Lrp/AsnC ligand binding domain-containing protein [Candidatus Bathyarchaeia archaeon]|nr:Lrp/AsnC ligand binding domain-containing protein [Candidatus Bathyarchaeia archaeon]
MEEFNECIYPHEMATAHLAIKCRSGLENRITEDLQEIEGVTSVHRTAGEFDILVKVEAIDYESLRKIIRWKIFTSDYIESITTLMCMRKSMCVVVE